MGGRVILLLLNDQLLDETSPVDGFHDVNPGVKTPEVDLLKPVVTGHTCAWWILVTCLMNQQDVLFSDEEGPSPPLGKL